MSFAASGTNSAPHLDSAVKLDWEALPQGMRELKDVVGPGAALAICAKWGGRTLYIPSRARADHPLSLLLGAEAATRLCTAMAGDRLSVPKTDAVMRQIKYRSIQRKKREGASIASLARAFDLTPRRILQILDAMEANQSEIEK